MVAVRKKTTNTSQMLRAAQPKRPTAAKPTDKRVPIPAEVTPAYLDYMMWVDEQGGGHPTRGLVPQEQYNMSPLSQALYSNPVGQNLAIGGEAGKAIVGGILETLLNPVGDKSKMLYQMAQRRMNEVDNVETPRGGTGRQAYGNAMLPSSLVNATGGAANMINSAAAKASKVMDAAGLGLESLLRSNAASWFSGDSAANLLGLTAGNRSYEPTLKNQAADLGWLLLNLAPAAGKTGKTVYKTAKMLPMLKSILARAASEAP